MTDPKPEPLTDAEILSRLDECYSLAVAIAAAECRCPGPCSPCRAEGVIDGIDPTGGLPGARIDATIAAQREEIERMRRRNEYLEKTLASYVPCNAQTEVARLAARVEELEDLVAKADMMDHAIVSEPFADSADGCRCPYCKARRAYDAALRGGE